MSQDIQEKLNFSKTEQLVLAIIFIIAILTIWTFVSTKEPKIVADTKKLNQLNLEDAQDLFIEREAKIRREKRAEAKSALLEKINFGNN